MFSSSPQQAGPSREFSARGVVVASPLAETLTAPPPHFNPGFTKNHPAPVLKAPLRTPAVVTLAKTPAIVENGIASKPAPSPHPAITKRLVAAGRNLAENGPQISLVTLYAPKYDVPTFNLSLAELAGYLRHQNPELNGTQIQFVEPDIELAATQELKNEGGLGFILEKLRQTRPQIIGISARLGTKKQLGDLIEALKQEQWAKETVIIVGNVLAISHATLSDEYPDLVYALGEGELALDALYQTVKGQGVGLGEIPNISYRDDLGEVHETPRKALSLKDQNWLPAFDMLSACLKANADITIRTTAGCNGGCTFCSLRAWRVSASQFGRWDAYPATRIGDMMAALAEAGVKSVNLGDDELMGNGDLDTVEAFAQELIQRDTGITFMASLRMDDIWSPHLTAEQALRRRRTLEKLKEAGLKSAFVGAETASPTQIRRYGKGYSVDVNTEALKILLEVGILPQLGFIPFDPFVNRWELMDNIAFLESTVLGRKVYDFVSSPINVMRAQRSTPYVTLLQKMGLLGQLDDTMFFCDATFVDPRLEYVAKLMKQWFEDIMSVRYAVLQLTRVAYDNDKYTPAIYQEASGLISEMHACDLALLKQLLEALPVDAYDEMLKSEHSPMPSFLKPENKALYETVRKQWQGQLAQVMPELEGIVKNHEGRRAEIERKMATCLQKVGW